MRHLILTAAAVLVIASAATASASAHTRHHHAHEASAPVAADAAPADSLSAHDAHIRNLHESGYNAHNDMDSHGNVRQN